MKQYELECLISTEVPEKELGLLTEKVSSFLGEEGGTAIEIKDLIRRGLGYPIKKKRSAYLVIFNFELAPERLKSLEEKLRIEPQLLRYMILTRKMVGRAPRIVLAPKREFPKEFPEAKTVPQKSYVPKSEKKVELKEIEEKLEEILNE